MNLWNIEMHSNESKWVRTMTQSTQFAQFGEIVGGAGWVRPGWNNVAGRWEPTAMVWCPSVGAHVIHNTADPLLSFRISGVDVHAAANCLRWAAAVTNSHPERERRHGRHGQRPRTSPCIKRCFFICSQPPEVALEIPYEPLLFSSQKTERDGTHDNSNLAEPLLMVNYWSLYKIHNKSYWERNSNVEELWIS